jgi:hypothetical protein
VGHLGHDVLTPAADSSQPGPLVTGISGPLLGGIGGPLHRNTQHCLQHEEIKQKLQSRRAQAAEGDPGSPSDLMQLLVEWMKCHTTTTDRRVGIYMESNGLTD